MISPEQCRAARAWLGWPQPELAKRAKVGLSTIRDFETATRTPIQNNRQAIQNALEAAGVRLLFDNERAAGIAIVDPGTLGVRVEELGTNPGTGVRT
jgi:ribosome-binding protein aMBF1 (putative translation factor)